LESKRIIHSRIVKSFQIRNPSPFIIHLIKNTLHKARPYIPNSLYIQKEEKYEKSISSTEKIKREKIRKVSGRFTSVTENKSVERSLLVLDGKLRLPEEAFANGQ
jgi:hypothetical protein